MTDARECLPVIVNGVKYSLPIGIKIDVPLEVAMVAKDYIERILQKKRD
jgi:hypothetical protein